LNKAKKYVLPFAGHVILILKGKEYLANIKYTCTLTGKAYINIRKNK